MRERAKAPRVARDKKTLLQNGRRRAEALGERLVEAARIALRAKNA
jgi:hypothetical protein